MGDTACRLWVQRLMALTTITSFYDDSISASFAPCLNLLSGQSLIISTDRRALFWRMSPFEVYVSTPNVSAHCSF